DGTISACAPFIPAGTLWTPGTPVYAMSDSYTQRIIARGLDGAIYYQLQWWLGHQCALDRNMPPPDVGDLVGRGSLTGFDNGNMIWTAPFFLHVYDLADSFPHFLNGNKNVAMPLFSLNRVVDIATCASENPALGEGN